MHRGIMKQIQTNQEYLRSLLEILEAPELRRVLVKRADPEEPATRTVKGKAEKVPDQKAICAAALAQLRELFAPEKQGLKEGVKIPFIEICERCKFDENEKTIFALIVAGEISGQNLGDNYRNADVFVKIISTLLGLQKMEIMPYFLSSGRLKRSGVFTQDRYGRDEALRPPSNLKESVIELLLNGSKPAKKKKSVAKTARPSQLAELLNVNVIAQETAKRQLSAVAFQHMERIGRPPTQGIAAPRLNTLLLGPTGCGKTYITKHLAEILGVPVVFCDATQYTETGYVGACVEDMLVQLQKAAGNDPKAAECGIIFIDEIDKLRAQNVGQSHNTERDVSGLSVQQELLKMLEGDKLHYEKSGSMSRPEYNFSIKNVLFIAAGAFQGLGDVVSERLKARTHIGFKDQAASAKVEHEQADLMRQVRPQDIIKYGFMPELVGRFPGIITLDKLTRKDFLSILGNQRTSLIEHYKNFFARNGIELEIPPSFLEEMADKAAARDLGARGLNSAVENFFAELMYELLDGKTDPGVRKVSIMDYLRGDLLKELFA